MPWYWDADGVAIPARLQTSQIVSSGPISRPHLMQRRTVGHGKVGARHLGHAWSLARRSPPRIGAVSQFSRGASGQDQIGSCVHDGWYA